MSKKLKNKIEQIKMLREESRGNCHDALEELINEEICPHEFMGLYDRYKAEMEAYTTVICILQED